MNTIYINYQLYHILTKIPKLANAIEIATQPAIAQMADVRIIPLP